MAEWVGFAVGVLVVAWTAFSVFATLILPRGSVSRFTFVLRTLIVLLLVRPAERIRDWDRRDKVLAYRGPLFLVLQLGTWLTLFLVGFALIALPQVGSFRGGFVFAGSSMFTLGFAQTTADSNGLEATAFLCSAFGLVAVALQISYLPVLYGAFNRRETLVTMLESRGGDPVWGPEVLARHVLVDIVDNLPQLYTDWETWAADVAESHANYPALIFFRSPHPLRSWIIALLAVLDAAAIQMALNPLTAPSECRLVLRMGFTALRDIASVLRIPFDPDPYPDDPISIDIDEFRRAYEHLQGAGWVAERSVEDAYPHFQGWRINYESNVYAIADRIDAPPALWSGPRSHPITHEAPRRPEDRRPPREGGAQREELVEQSRRRRVARAMRGQTLPTSLRRIAEARREVEEAQAAANAASAVLDSIAGTSPDGDSAQSEEPSAPARG